MSNNYEFHWARTHYYRNVVHAESLSEAIDKQRILFDACDWDDFEDDNEITYYELEWVDECRATDAEQEYFKERLNNDYE